MSEWPLGTLSLVHLNVFLPTYKSQPNGGEPIATMFRSLNVFVILSTLAAPIMAQSEKSVLFQTDVAPLISQRCYHCHNDADAKGGLSLSRHASVKRGGDSGPPIVVGQPDQSLLIEMIAGDDPEMPKDEPALTKAEIEVLRTWIRDGAVWPADFEVEEPAVTDTQWWSLQALLQPKVPQLSTAGTAWSRNAIDAFVYRKLEANQLHPSPAADRRSLIRRLYFDLIGLPPSFDEVTTFVNDPDPQAYEKLVQRLLDSPHYGERWARHWLDVVHYGDTHGYDKDKPRPNAWPYRDYVIRSFNEDKPYTRFVMEQIAGDIFWPHTVDGIEATGFISAGPWDFIGHAEVSEEKIDGQVARHLDRDDMVTSTMNSFLSLTVQCARCHNHKFDPITQEHYYSLQAVFAALDRADREYDSDPAIGQRRVDLKSTVRELKQRQQEIEDQIRGLGGEELAKVDREIATRASFQSEPAEYGYHSSIEQQQDVEKWVQVDLGEAVDLTQIVLIGCKDNFNDIGAGFGFPVRFRVEAASDPDFQQHITTIVDHTSADFENPGVEPVKFTTNATDVRYVRLTAVKLAPRKDDFILAVAELFAIDPQGQNIARGKTVTARDSVKISVRWQKPNLVDGKYVETAAAKSQRESELADWRTQREEVLAEKISVDVRETRSAVAAQLAAVNQDLADLPKPRIIYSGTIHHGNGAFRGTGHLGGRPREIRLLRRGNILSPAHLVTAGTVPLIPSVNWQFQLHENHVEGDRRAALARWITRHDNPLTWRSIVNRVWQYHFGRGIVDSPNDFGRMGQLPSHPELLDWLACEFRDSGQSLKELHRWIVTSNTYRQASDDVPAFRQIDAGNQFLWRMNRRLLDAESIRDAVLTVSGKLDRKMFGPGFQDFVLERPEHSPHYEYHLYNPDDVTTHRRSVYRFLVRSQQQPFMQTLDCADPSESVAKRNTTLTSIQALTLLNNQFMVRMAEHFASHAESLSQDPSTQVDFVYRTAIGHRPTTDTSEALVSLAQEYGLANVCRVVFNMNSFVFID